MRGDWKIYEAIGVKVVLNLDNGVPPRFLG